MVITSHICRGNYHSTFFSSGPYDTVADYVFAKENVNALFLEYDDERSGGFAPLAKIEENAINGMEEQNYNMIDNVLNKGEEKKKTSSLRAEFSSGRN